MNTWDVVAKDESMHGELLVFWRLALKDTSSTSTLVTCRNEVENVKGFLFRKRERHRNIADTNDDLKKSWRLLLKNTSSPSTGVTVRAPTPEDVMMTIQEGLSGVYLSGQRKKDLEASRERRRLRRPAHS